MNCWFMFISLILPAVVLCQDTVSPYPTATVTEGNSLELTGTTTAASAPARIQWTFTRAGTSTVIGVNFPGCTYFGAQEDYLLTGCSTSGTSHSMVLTIPNVGSERDGEKWKCENSLETEIKVTATTTATPTDDNGGLSTGAKVGIAIGAIAGAAAIVCVIVFALYKSGVIGKPTHPDTEEGGRADKKKKKKEPAVRDEENGETPTASPGKKE